MTDMVIIYPKLPESCTYDASWGSSSSQETPEPLRHPTTLYRIYSKSTVSQRIPNYGGFIAGSPFKPIDINDPEDMAKEVELHLDWYSRERTIFISTSESFSWVQHHAALRDTRQKQSNVRVAQISTALALAWGAKLYSMTVLLESFCRCRVPDVAKNAAQYEWVFVGAIPACAVVGDYSAREFGEFSAPGLRTGVGLVDTLADPLEWGSRLKNLNIGCADYGASRPGKNIWHQLNDPIPLLPPKIPPISLADNVYITSFIGRNIGSDGGLTTKNELLAEEKQEALEDTADDDESIDILLALTCLSIDEATVNAKGTGIKSSAAPTTPITSTTADVGSYSGHLPEVTLVNSNGTPAEPPKVPATVCVRIGEYQLQTDKQSMEDLFDFGSENSGPDGGITYPKLEPWQDWLDRVSMSR